MTRPRHQTRDAVARIAYRLPALIEHAARIVLEPWRDGAGVRARPTGELTGERGGAGGRAEGPGRAAVAASGAAVEVAPIVPEPVATP